ncbi:MAG: hypothetical protein ABFD59_08260 [Smithella sp.]
MSRLTDALDSISKIDWPWSHPKTAELPDALCDLFKGVTPEKVKEGFNIACCNLGLNLHAHSNPGKKKEAINGILP